MSCVSDEGMRNEHGLGTGTSLSPEKKPYK